MSPERIALYAAQFPRGFASILEITPRISIERLIAKGRGRHLPAAAKRAVKGGELRVKLKIDPNGASYEQGDIILNHAVDAVRGDWLVVGIGKRFEFVVGNGFGSDFYQYAVVRVATEIEAAPAKAARQARSAAVSDWAANS